MSIIQELKVRSDYNEEYSGGAGFKPPPGTSSRIVSISNPWDAAKIAHNVMDFELRFTDEYPTENPRCQLNGGPAKPKAIANNTEFYAGFRIGVKTQANGGPDPIPVWCNIWEYFGPEYNGSPTFELELSRDSATKTKNELRWRLRNEGNHEMFRQAFATEKWHTFVLHGKSATKANGGYVELWVDGVQVTFSKPAGGTTTKYEFNLVETNVNDKEGNEIIPQIYRYGLETFSPFHVLYDWCVVATTKAEAEWWVPLEEEEPEPEPEPENQKSYPKGLIAAHTWEVEGASTIWEALSDHSTSSKVKGKH